MSASRMELSFENFNNVAGGINAKQAIALTVALATGSAVAYKTYNHTMKVLDTSDGTAKNGNANSNGAASAENGLAPGTYNNVNSGGKQMIVQQGSGNINNSGNNSM